MKLLLASDFYSIGSKYLNRFFDLDKKHTCLFVGYACEDDDEMFASGVIDIFESLNFNVMNLTPDFDMKNNSSFDLVFVRGGNTTKLVHYLKKYNQFEYVKNLALNGALYAGNSAGSVLAGSDTEWTLRAEPYEKDLKKIYGKDALLGFGFVDKMVFVHCSRLRMLHHDEFIEGSKNWRVFNNEFYAEYLIDRKNYKEGTYITLGNNQVYYQNDGESKILTYDWSSIPVYKDKK